MTRRGFRLACALLFVAACRDTLPGAPSELTTGIVVYQDANFLGASAYITSDISNLSDVRGPCEKTEERHVQRLRVVLARVQTAVRR